MDIGDRLLSPTSRYPHRMLELEELQARRRRNWRQVPEASVPTSEEARAFIDEVGLVTLYAASPEFPSLYQAHMGDPNPPTFATWDSPSGFVYTWRWELGRPHAAFYGVVVAKKPTWIAFDRLPTVLGALMERRTPQELYEAGELSADGLRVAEAFTGTEGVLSTKELRARAGFEKGKESRAAYLKAVEELDARLWLAKRFFGEGEADEMHHALVRTHYAEAAQAGLAMDRTDALTDFLAGHLAHAAYFDPKAVGRHLKVDPAIYAAAIDRLEKNRQAQRRRFGKAELVVAEA